eukprot:TRINITY_DN28854_c0_g1_i2.p6 TRINITY_DN28854_c0_g1~~TRINITY_DN28854_c0_g1_i2.p6  ORF type:complete len:103 (-),score=24.45 TRINITY_DN28854_c0_g1_i2:42-350(-)
MGQKVNPIGYRVGVNKESSSIWCVPKKEYVESFHEDLKIIDYVKKRLSAAMTSKVKIYRKSSVITCLLYTSDAADDTPCVDLGGRRIIKKKKTMTTKNSTKR